METIIRHRLERIEPRFAANLGAMIFCEGITAPATIKNISIYGALLECRHLPEVGASISVMTERHEVHATVIWTGADRFGVLLSSPVDPAEFTKIDENNPGWS